LPHYYFDLTDGVTRRDRRSLDCTDDAEAIVKATAIAKEVFAVSGNSSHPGLHISIMHNTREVSRVAVSPGH
jgi:hypothetical protein